MIDEVLLEEEEEAIVTSAMIDTELPTDSDQGKINTAEIQEVLHITKEENTATETDTIMDLPETIEADLAQEADTTDLHSCLEVSMETAMVAEGTLHNLEEMMDLLVKTEIAMMRDQEVASPIEEHPWMIGSLL